MKKSALTEQKLLLGDDQDHNRDLQRVNSCGIGSFSLYQTNKSVSPVTLAVVELIYCLNKLLDSLTFRIYTENSARGLLMMTRLEPSINYQTNTS